MMRVHHVNMTRVYTIRDHACMHESKNERLRQARMDAGFKSARSAALRFGWKPSTYAAHENGQNDFGEDLAQEYARSFKTSANALLGLEKPQEEALTRTIPVVGYVGAGAEVHLVDDHAKGGGLDEAPAPASVGHDCVAVKVRGDSMEPRFFDGEILYYDKHHVTQDMLVKIRHIECVVALEDGRVFVKRLRPGSRPSLWTLWSYNAEPIQDVRIKWAAPVHWRYTE